MWEEFTLGKGLSLQETLEIINDALCYGFEFKVENHTLYFKDEPII